MMLPYEAAKALGIKLHGHLMCCPHPDHEDKSPSCLVRPGNRKWVCLSCRKVGDAVDLAIYVGGMTPKDAREWAGYEQDAAPLPPEKPPVLGADALAWLGQLERRQTVAPAGLKAWCASRGLSAEVALNLGWRDCPLPIETAPECMGFRRQDGKIGGLWGKPGVWVPVYVPGYYQPVLWRRRLYRPHDINGKKIKVVAPSSPWSQWGWGVSGRIQNGVIHIVEGEPDWLAYAALHRGERILARYGSTMLRRETLMAFAPGVGKVILATHQNAATRQLSGILGELGLQVIDRTVPETRDWADRARDGET